MMFGERASEINQLFSAAATLLDTQIATDKYFFSALYK
jgi:hypothetical protein